MRLTVGSLLVAVVLLVAALGTGRIALAWGSVALSAMVAVMIIMRWRRRRDASESAEPVGLLDDEPVDGAQIDPAQIDPLVGAGPDAPAAAQPAQLVPVIAEGQGGAVSTAAPGTHATSDAQFTDAEVTEPGEEDTDAADLLVVYELTEQVLVVDEHPRYHLARCPWPDRAMAEQLPVREARELGFTPCARCRPDTALARRHRAASAATGRS